MFRATQTPKFEIKGIASGLTWEQATKCKNNDLNIWYCQAPETVLNPQETEPRGQNEETRGVVRVLLHTGKMLTINNNGCANDTSGLIFL